MRLTAIQAGTAMDLGFGAAFFDNAPAPAGWRKDEPPKFRRIVATGQIIFSDDDGGFVNPFCGVIRWRWVNNTDGLWVWADQEGAPSLSVARRYGSTVKIFQWIDLPAEVSP